MPLIQPLHRHADVRLVVFTSGIYRERSFERGAIFAPGDFVFRPRYFAHDGFAEADAGYVRLGVSARAAALFAADHGWASRRGCIDLADMQEAMRDPCGGNRVLEGSSTAPLDDLDCVDDASAAIGAAHGPPIGEIAKAMRLTPCEMTRTFARAHFLSPVRYRKEARLQRALRSLAETVAPLAHIAQDAGYADQSHMTREMTQATGITPARLRALVAIG
jgi:AraC-like DNA-binding protein